MERPALQAWIDGYEAAWRTAGAEPLRKLFTDDASYLPSPYEEPLRGLEAIGRFWEDTRDGPDEAFSMTSEVVAVEGDTGVARVFVRYGDPVSREYRDLWIVELAPDGRCSHFEEWPFFPGQPRTATP
jgi:ketosteroid isomerase-like protein